MLDKFEIARALREIALLMEVKGENSFKVRAYHNGAETIENLAEDLERLVDDKRLTSLPGIGNALAAKIAELYLTGRCAFLEQLREELPAGVIELSQIPGISVKRIQTLHSHLGITDIGELQAACRAGLVSTIPGFGQKTEQKILEGISAYRARENKMRLVDAQELGVRLETAIEGIPGLGAVEIVGSVRRWCETASDVNLLAKCSHHTAVLQAFQRFILTTEVEHADQDSARIRLANGFRANLSLTDDSGWVPNLVWTTGSQSHVEKLGKIAQAQGYRFDRRGLSKGEERINLQSEEALYRQLGLSYVPPELREDLGELEEAAAGSAFGDLIEHSDIRGMIHCHTLYSDGKHSIEAMARAAEAMGMEYITITDHSPSAHYAGGLSIERMKMQWEEIERVQERVRIKILRGTESDILEDGGLDYPDEILQKLDVIVASVHSRMRMDSDQMTKRLIACMRQPQFKIWGHALGRLVLKRAPIDCRVEEILDAAAESRVAIEVNGDPHRLDMEPKWLREARGRGIKFVISVDAHSVENLHYLAYGVHTARRAGMRTNEVLNALSVQDFQDAVKPL